ncbi:MAG: CBS domain-containing protein [Porphyrobacter sp.]|nr:CBS domain-containing protein [Porphyrobacter sp.]
MKISECMTQDVSLVSPDDTIERAAQIMGSIDAGVLPVTNGDRLVGMITDRDIAVRGVAEGCGPSARVGDIMSREVKYCYDDAETDEVLDNMAQIQVRRLPVVDHDKRLVGIVSLSDLDHEAPDRGGHALREITQPSGRHNQSR